MATLTAARTAHIIDNADVSLTYCGAILWEPADPTDTAAVRLAYVEGYAVFDDVEVPADALGCAECHDAYNR